LRFLEDTEFIFWGDSESATGRASFAKFVCQSDICGLRIDARARSSTAYRNY